MADCKVDGLSVVLLLARDARATTAFYRNLLGLPLHEEEHGGRHVHSACRLGSVYFTVQWATDLTAPEPDRGYDFLQLCFTVSDLDAFVETLARHNITPLHPPTVFEATRFITVLDPDRRHVRIMTPWTGEE